MALLSWTIQNFKSFRDPATLLFTRKGELKPDADPLKTAALFGTNGSGKSNFLASFRVVAGAAKAEGKEGALAEPFLLDSVSRRKPSRFEGVLTLPGLPGFWRYSIELSQGAGAPVSETLETSSDGETWVLVFHRDRTGAKFPGLAPEEAKPLEDAAGAGAAVLSLASRTANPALRALQDFFRSMRVCSDEMPLDDAFTLPKDFFHRKEERESLTRYLSAMDSGVFSLMLKRGTGSVLSRLLVMRRAPDGKLYSLPIACESAGIRKMLTLYATLQETLRNGGFAAVDGLNSGLHPGIVRAIFALFANPESNPKDAQLLFISHDATGLQEKSLESREVWFAKKDPCGCSSLVRLTDLGKKAAKKAGVKREKAYLDGTFIPVPDRDAFFGLSGIETISLVTAGKKKEKGKGKKKDK